MKQILAVTFATAALLFSSCAHTKSCCAETSGNKSKADECKTCDAGAKPGTTATKKAGPQH